MLTNIEKKVQEIKNYKKKEAESNYKIGFEIIDDSANSLEKINNDLLANNYNSLVVQNYLEKVTHPASAFEKITSNVIGPVAGVISYPIFNIVADKKMAVLSSVVLGVIVDGLYKAAYPQVDSQVSAEEFYKQISENKQLCDAIKNKCEGLAAELCRILHYRDMLLGLDKKNLEQVKEIAAKVSQDDIQKFIQFKIKEFFYKAFLKLDEAQSDMINNASKEGVIQRLKQLFSNTKELSFCIKKIHLEFLKACVIEMADRAEQESYFKKHPIKVAIILTVLFAPIIFLIISGSGGAALGFALAALALTSYAISSLLAEIIPYKRKSQDRKELHNISKNLEKIHEKISSEEVDIELTSANQEALTMTNNFNKLNYALLPIYRKNIGLGSPNVWLKIFKMHYKHSGNYEMYKFSNNIESLAIQSYTQIENLSQEINTRKVFLTLSQYIKDTKTFLQNKKDNFELKSNIKHQILMVVARLNKDTSIPDDLKNFYEDDLGCNKENLDIAKQFYLDWEKNPQNKLDKLNTIKTILSEKIERLKSSFVNIFDFNNENINKIDSAYLNNSFSFLLSLSSEEYHVYRALFLSHLNKLYENQDNRVIIKEFVKDNFGIDNVEMYFQEVQEFVSYYPTTLSAEEKTLAYISYNLVTNLDAVDYKKKKIEECRKEFGIDKVLLTDDKVNSSINLEELEHIIKNTQEFLKKLESAQTEFNKKYNNSKFQFKDCFQTQVNLKLISLLETINAAIKKVDDDALESKEVCASLLNKRSTLIKQLSPEFKAHLDLNEMQQIRVKQLKWNLEDSFNIPIDDDSLFKTSMYYLNLISRIDCAVKFYEENQKSSKYIKEIKFWIGLATTYQDSVKICFEKIIEIGSSGLEDTSNHKGLNGQGKEFWNIFNGSPEKIIENLTVLPGTMKASQYDLAIKKNSEEEEEEQLLGAEENGNSNGVDSKTSLTDLTQSFDIIDFSKFRQNFFSNANKKEGLSAKEISPQGSHDGYMSTDDGDMSPNEDVYVTPTLIETK